MFLSGREYATAHASSHKTPEKARTIFELFSENANADVKVLDNVRESSIIRTGGNTMTKQQRELKAAWKKTEAAYEKLINGRGDIPAWWMRWWSNTGHCNFCIILGVSKPWDNNVQKCVLCPISALTPRVGNTPCVDETFDRMITVRVDGNETKFRAAAKTRLEAMRVAVAKWEKEIENSKSLSEKIEELQDYIDEDVSELFTEIARTFTPSEVFGSTVIDEIGTAWANEHGLLTPGVLKGFRNGEG